MRINSCEPGLIVGILDTLSITCHIYFYGCSISRGVDGHNGHRSHPYVLRFLLVFVLWGILGVRFQGGPQGRLVRPCKVVS